jgi:hypothetical protein
MGFINSLVISFETRNKSIAEASKGIISTALHIQNERKKKKGKKSKEKKS